MTRKKHITGFSKLSKEEKLNWVAENFFSEPAAAAEELKSFWHADAGLQSMLDGFSENTLSNYPLPYGIAPNFLINGRAYAIPMVTEESSVVAAAASAAKFWSYRGGFHAEVASTVKLGQVHFTWKGKAEKLRALFPELISALRADAAPITYNMEKRGGGVSNIELRDLTNLEPEAFQLMVAFETCDSMGANFINTVLESFAKTLREFVATHPAFTCEERELSVLMAILSNYTPECLARAWVSCPVEALEGACEGEPGARFAERFRQAVRLARIDPYRAVTHNKGILNGVDAVVLATANDFRAAEACAHAYASRDGQYRGLSDCSIEDGQFRFGMELPLALGAVGGLTRLHPLARRSLELLGNPSAPQLMMIVAVAGLAQNFAALRSLVTTGIQKGHMKMHLHNILIHFGATEREMKAAALHFADKIVSFTAVREFLDLFRHQNGEARLA
jgi:hydroxymethylglutaryl-CoA reductase